MSWQEEQRKLDQELATGQISADEYRTRRNKLLADAASPSPLQQSAPTQAPTETTQLIQPISADQPPPQASAQPSQPQASPPQPSNPQAAAQSSDSGDSDRTQVVPGQAVDKPADQAERTQVVSGGWQSAQAPRTGDGERTQVVPGGIPGVPQQPGHFRPPPTQGNQQQYLGQQQQQPQQQPPWATGENEAPPWAGAEFPPIQQNTYDWTRQGPEVFEESSGGSKKVLVIVAAVVVVALIGAGIWFFGLNDQEKQAAPGPSSPPPATSSTPSGPPRPLEGVDGEVDPNSSGDITVDGALEKQQFAPDEATELKACRAAEGQTEMLYRQTWYTFVHVFECNKSGSAAETATKLLDVQKTFTFTEFDAPESLDGMVLENATDVPDVPVDARVFYASGDYVVRVEVRGKTRADVDSGLTEVLGSVTQNYPKK
ncbi:hypothetical protein [Actinokineospora pegani]|uniref:hypothetical protein n=1 Tax=Actinokineospora pegani TaxID=2654637 RepID=UPI0012E9CAD3|nr:hypothetical protein [Actinokineospora pegani]